MISFNIITKKSKVGWFLTQVIQRCKHNIAWQNNANTQTMTNCNTQKSDTRYTLLTEYVAACMQLPLYAKQKQCLPMAD